MIVAWRIDKRRHTAQAFTGDGARVHGGRWNHKGTPVVYLADSLALATLEKFVHLGRAVPRIQWVAFRVRIPPLIVRSLDRRRLPMRWREEPPGEATKDLGTAWVEDRSSAVLKVPSVLIPIEFNLVVNPLHPDFRRLQIDAPEAFVFDARMWK